MDNAREALTTTASAMPDSPWVIYLTGKKLSADHFLREMEAGVITVPGEDGKLKKQKTHRINRPDETARNRFAEALAEKPERVDRLLLLVQASVAAGEPIRRIVMELVEAGIRRLGVLSLPDILDSSTFSDAVRSWLSDIPEKRLKPDTLNLLFLFLHLGRYRHLLDDGAAFRLVAAALSKTTKARPPHVQPNAPTPTLLDVLLVAPPDESTLASVSAYFDASQAQAGKLHDQIRAQEARITRLTGEIAGLDATIERLRVDHAELHGQKTALERTVVELEQRLVDVRDGYKHQIYETRERMRGLLQGQLTRWLETALDAAQSDPPWNEAIQERLEDALKLIAKEIQWLQPSA